MSQSDFIITSGSLLPFSNNGGSARFHDQLSNPYLSGGVYYRSFETYSPWDVNANNSAAPAASFVPATASLTSSTGYAYGKSYSLTALFRIESGSFTTTIGSGDPSGMCLTFKGEKNLNFKTGSLVQDNYDNNVYVNNIESSGYRLSLSREYYDAMSASLYLRCASVKTNLSTNTSGNIASPATDAYLKYIGKLPINTWHKVRMDIIPVTGSHDIIKVYTGSLSDDSWTLMNVSYIYSQNSGSYVPWNFGNNPNQYGYMGFAVLSARCRALVDNFQVFTEDI